MSTFGGLILTNKGKTLQSKAQTGVQLNFTRVALGDGELGSSSILELNALKNEVKSLSITKLKVLSGGRAVVGGVLSNQDMTTGFYWREIGVFAQDPDAGEVLYCYGNAGELAEYIPAGDGSDIIEKSIDVQTLVGNASNVIATIDESLVFATASELSTVDLKIDNHAADSDIHVTTSEKTSWDNTAQALSEHQAERASKTEYGHVMVGDGINVDANGVISIAEMTASNVSTSDGSNVQSEIDSLKSSVSDGKVQVRDAITGKGGTVADADGDGVPTFQELEDGITGIDTVIPFPESVPIGTREVLTDYDPETGESYVVYLYSSYSTLEKGNKYDRNGNLLQTHSNCVGYTRHGYSLRVPDTYGGLHDVYDNNGNLLFRSDRPTTAKDKKDRSMLGLNNFYYTYMYSDTSQFVRKYTTTGTYINQQSVALDSGDDGIMAQNMNQRPFYASRWGIVRVENGADSDFLDVVRSSRLIFNQSFEKLGG